MSREAFAIVLSNPFEKKPIILYKDTSARMTRDVLALLVYDKIVAFDIDTAIESFRNCRIDRLPYIIDVITAVKLVKGQPKSNFKEGKEPWTLKTILSSRIRPNTHILFDKFQQLRMTTEEFLEECEKNLSEIMNSFESAWHDIQKELVLKGEQDRFDAIENPIYNIFLETTLRGISVPKEKLHAKLRDLDRTKYSSLKKLELHYNYIGQRVTPSMSWDDIHDHTNLDYLAEDFDRNFWETAENFADHCNFLSVLVSFWKASIDFNALLRYTVDEYHKICI